MVSVQQDYDLGPEFEGVVLRCILTSPQFVSRYRTILSEDMFTWPEHRFLYGLVTRYHDHYGGSPAAEVLIDLIKGERFGKRAEAIKLVEQAEPVEDRQYVEDRVVRWAKWSSITSVLNYHDRQDPRSFADQVSEAARTGDELIAGHTTLHDEDERDSTAPRVPTPWGCINGRLGGGPELGDLCMFLSFINVGKTLALVNVAAHAAELGLLVVFVTFEDGELKIKRRFTQRLTGLGREQIAADPREAGRKRREILDAVGGSVHIKQGRTRRTTVSDVGAFVRSVEDAEGRGCALLAVDYADRFSPPRRRSEDRNEYREVFEECKYLALDMNLVHWTASQSQRQTYGKEIVKLDNVGEAIGKAESADLVIGLGQTAEDYELDRMTMHLAKVRDEKKWASESLMVDAERQVVYE